MAKLKVDEIEATSTNQDVKVITKGSTGALEVKGDTDEGTLRLNCSAQSHGVKLKAPPSNSGQSYTMVMPDNQIAASKLLKVKSVTNNSAQLEYADTPTEAQFLSNLSATNLTSGTIPGVRLPTLPASGGAGLKLVHSAKVPAGSGVTSVSITNITQNTLYYIIGKNITCANGSYGKTFVGIEWLNASGSAQNYITWNNFHGETQHSNYGSNGRIDLKPQPYNANYQGVKHHFTAFMGTSTYHNQWMFLNGHNNDYAANFAHYDVWAAWTDWAHDALNLRINGLRFTAHDYYGGQHNLMPDSEFLMYQFMES
tara:strand:- start:1809 stop:2744 length:936 start_codon:yes stop_codon:yes gene_type:complete